MNTALLLATSALAGFLVGFLLARNTWLTFEGRQARRDLRTVLNLRSELERHTQLLRAEKKRSSLLLGLMRTTRRQLRGLHSVSNGRAFMVAAESCEKGDILLVNINGTVGPVSK